MRSRRVRITRTLCTLCTPTGVVNIHFQVRPIYAVPRCTLQLNNASVVHEVREFRNFYFISLISRGRRQAHDLLSIWADIWVTRFSEPLQLFTNYPSISHYNRKCFFFLFLSFPLTISHYST